MVNDYYFYRRFKETCSHIAWCPIAYNFWTMGYGFLGISWVMPGMVKDEICVWNGICGGKSMWYSFLLLFFGVLWKERNKMIFKGSEEDINRVKNK